jgi:hypothetical protein
MSIEAPHNPVQAQGAEAARRQHEVDQLEALLNTPAQHPALNAPEERLAITDGTRRIDPNDTDYQIFKQGKLAINQENGGRHNDPDESRGRHSADEVYAGRHRSQESNEPYGRHASAETSEGTTSGGRHSAEAQHRAAENVASNGRTISLANFSGYRDAPSMETQKKRRMSRVGQGILKATGMHAAGNYVKREWDAARENAADIRAGSQQYTSQRAARKAQKTEAKHRAPEPVKIEVQGDDVPVSVEVQRKRPIARLGKGILRATGFEGYSLKRDFAGEVAELRADNKKFTAQRFERKAEKARNKARAHDASARAANNRAAEIRRRFE